MLVMKQELGMEDGTPEYCNGDHWMEKEIEVDRLEEEETTKQIFKINNL